MLPVWGWSPFGPKIVLTLLQAVTWLLVKHFLFNGGKLSAQPENIQGLKDAFNITTAAVG
jgi:hypothetical protein